MKSGVILAGGSSTRMGVDKCTISFCGKPLIYWSYIILKDVVDEIIVSVSKGKDIEALKIILGDKMNFVEDKKPNLGPLLGIYSSLKMAKGKYVAIIPCDSPLVHVELYKRLFKIAEGFDAAVPMVNGFYEPLHGVYKRIEMLDAIENVINDGQFRPKATYKFLNVVALSEDEIKKFDPNLHSFFNINSFSDITMASDIFKSSRKILR